MNTIRIIGYAVVASATMLFSNTQSAEARILHWTFDGSLNNTSGAFNGMAIGDAYAGTNNGVSGGALVLDGAGDAVSISPAVLEPGSYTILFWAKDDVHAGFGGGFSTLICDSVAYTDELVMHRYCSPTTGNVKYGGYYVGAQVDALFSDTAFTTWRMFTLEVDNYANGFADFTMYRNTNWAASKTGRPEFNGLEGELYLGNRLGLDRSYKGMIDDLQIYNFKLTAACKDWLYAHPGFTLPVGDVNLDGAVNAVDAQVLAAHWSAVNATWDIGDFNGDKVVDRHDAVLLATNWTGSHATDSLPEPSAFVILLSMAFACLFFVNLDCGRSRNPKEL